MHTQALRGTRAHTILEAITDDDLRPPSLVDTLSVIVETFFYKKKYDQTRFNYEFFATVVKLISLITPED